MGLSISEKNYAIKRVRNEASKIINQKVIELRPSNLGNLTIDDYAKLIESEEIRIVTNKEAINIIKNRVKSQYGGHNLHIESFIYGLDKYKAKLNEEYVKLNKIANDKINVFTDKVNAETQAFEDSIMLGGDKSDMEACLLALSKIK